MVFFATKIGDLRIIDGLFFVTMIGELGIIRAFHGHGVDDMRPATWQFTCICSGIPWNLMDFHNLLVTCTILCQYSEEGVFDSNSLQEVVMNEFYPYVEGI